MATSGTTYGIVYFVTNLGTIYGLSSFIFCQTYLFNLGAIFSNHPKFKV
jgi:hypothetical protein